MNSDRNKEGCTRSLSARSAQSVISCDNLITIPTPLLDSDPAGRLDLDTRIRLDQALRYALDIQY